MNVNMNAKEERFDIGRFIREIDHTMIQFGVNQQEFFDQFRITKRALSDWKRKKYYPSPKVLAIFHHVFQNEAFYLDTNEGERARAELQNAPPQYLQELKTCWENVSLEDRERRLKEYVERPFPAHPKHERKEALTVG